MAVPKRKTSKARHNSKHSAWKLEAPEIVECPQCHEPKLPHRVCPSCGYYRSKEVIKIEKKA
jgi:large subunit ribosomal protein L32